MDKYWKDYKEAALKKKTTKPVEKKTAPKEIPKPK